MKNSVPQPRAPASPPPSAVASSRHRVTRVWKKQPWPRLWGCEHRARGPLSGVGPRAAVSWSRAHPSCRQHWALSRWAGPRGVLPGTGGLPVTRGDFSSCTGGCARTQPPGKGTGWQSARPGLRSRLCPHELWSDFSQFRERGRRRSRGREGAVTSVRRCPAGSGCTANAHGPPPAAVAVPGAAHGPAGPHAADAAATLCAPHSQPGKVSSAWPRPRGRSPPPRGRPSRRIPSPASRATATQCRSRFI